MTRIEVNLPEFLHPEMDILFLALNPPEVSNKKGHYFSRNLSFWNLMYDAGLITKPIFNPVLGDTTIFGGQTINYKNAVYGVTDLNRDVVETHSGSVDVEQTQVARTLNILKTHETKVLCLIHSKVATSFEEAGLIRRSGYGLVGTYENTKIYEMPFHSASIACKHLLYCALQAELE
jgi:hypothetical protein